MKEVKRFEAEDGTIHMSMEGCIQHERKLVMRQFIKDSPSFKSDEERAVFSEIIFCNWDAFSEIFKYVGD